MEINNLLEGADNYKSMQADASRLADKWSQSGLLEGLGDRDKDSMAVILENQAKQIVSEANNVGTSTASFTAGAGEQWAGVALPLVRKVFSQIVAKDFVSVQPMNLPSGLVFYLDFKYGSANGGRADGDNMYGNVSTANDKIGVDVDPSGGLYGTGKFGYSINEATGTAAAATVAAAALSDVNYDAEITLADFETVAIATSSIANFDATAIRAFRISSGSVLPEYTRLSGGNIVFVTEDGVVTNGEDEVITYSKQPVDNDRGDFEADSAAAVDTSITIPEIDVQLQSEAVVAKTRKLKAQWTP